MRDSQNQRVVDPVSETGSRVCAVRLPGGVRRAWPTRPADHQALIPPGLHPGVSVLFDGLPHHARGLPLPQEPNVKKMAEISFSMKISLKCYRALKECLKEVDSALGSVRMGFSGKSTREAREAWLRIWPLLLLCWLCDLRPVA